MTRSQLKQIIGGIDGSGDGSGGCSATKSCSVYNRTDGTTHYGFCSQYFGYAGWICECATDLGYYIPEGQSVCVA
ncbi:MAG: hypothetical protein ACTHM5_11790 [Ginsengibacter sp.]